MSALPVSIPISGLSVSVSCLEKHLQEKSLPDGWIRLSDSSTDGFLVLAKFSINPPLLVAKATFLVKVDSELKWTLSYNDCPVEIEQCNAVLGNIPRQLSSVDSLMQLISTLQSCHICCGSAVADFQQLVDSRNGVFKDPTGTLVRC